MNLSFRIDRVNKASDSVSLRAIDVAKISLNVEGRDNIVA